MTLLKHLNIDWHSKLFLAIIFSLLLAAVLSGNGYQSFEWVLALTDEDRWLEALQALGYLTGFVICLFGIVTSRARLFFVVWAILTLLFLGEETSWGQRIFGYEVVGVQKYSLQNEFNIHNLEFFNAGGLTSAEDWKALLKALLDIQFVFQVCFFFYFAVMPLIIGVSETLRLLAYKLQYIPPSRQLMLVFLVSFIATYLCVLLVGDEVYKNAIVEIRETIFGAVVPIYLYQTFKLQK